MHRVDGHRLHFRQQRINRKLYRPCPKTFQGCRGCLRCSLDEIFMGVPASVWAAYGLGARLVAIAFSLSAAHGPGLALVLGTVCAALAVAVNAIRFNRLRTP